MVIELSAATYSTRRCADPGCEREHEEATGWVVLEVPGYEASREEWRVYAGNLEHRYRVVLNALLRLRRAAAPDFMEEATSDHPSPV